MSRTPFSAALKEYLARSSEGSFIRALRAFHAEQTQALREAHRGGAGGLETAAAIAELTDAVVLQTYAAALEQHPGGVHALVALGGYGRGEMAPHSDVDLLFLFRRKKDESAEFIAGVLHPLWDLGFTLGYSSRTLATAIRMASQDLKSCTAMMDGRLLAGEQALFDEFQQRLYKRVSKKGLAARLQKGRRQRARSRGSVQLLEPNVKESPGGLREIQALEWALKSRGATPELEEAWKQYFEAEDRAALRRGCAFLWRVRCELHFSSGRRHEVLEHAIKPEIARRLGYGKKDPQRAAERFMQHYYLHARTTYHLVDLVFEQLTRKRRIGGRQVVLAEGVVAAGGEILLPQGETFFARQPLGLLRIFQLMQARSLKLSEEAQCIIRAGTRHLDETLRCAPEARDIFMGILKRKQRVGATLRAMHDLGVLGAYLPEFGELTCLVQYDIYHLYTVDEHTLVALENLEALGRDGQSGPLQRVFAELQRRELLYLGVMLHDIGKSRRSDHIASGLEMAAALLERLELPAADRRLVLFLVEHHQDMVILSQRRDLDDYKMLSEFAGLFANAEWLRALYLLSYADLSAVASEAWSDWRGALLWELYHKAGEQLESGFKSLEEKQRARQLLDAHLQRITGEWPAQQIAAFEAHVQQLPPRYLVAYEQEQIEHHLDLIERLDAGVVEVDFVEYPAHTEVVICTRDRRQLLAKICGVLAVDDINILRADVNTRDDEVVLDIFQVTDADRRALLPERKKRRLRERLEMVISGRRKAREFFASYTPRWERRKKSAYARAPEVSFENQVSERYTVIETRVEDDAGLLYKITYALGELELDIHMAIVNTVANCATDTFYVVDARGEKILNYETLDSIRQRLLERLES